VLFANLPDPSSPGFPAVISVLIGFAGSSYGFWRRLPRDEIQWAGFLGAYFGVGFGLVAYLVILLWQL
jgi:hypothetical protein